MASSIAGALTAAPLPSALASRVPPSAPQSGAVPPAPANIAPPGSDPLAPDVIRTLFEYYRSIGAIPPGPPMPQDAPHRTADDASAAWREIRSLGWKIVNNPSERPLTVLDLQPQDSSPPGSDWDLPLRRHHARRALQAVAAFVAAPARIARPAAGIQTRRPGD